VVENGFGAKTAISPLADLSPQGSVLSHYNNLVTKLPFLSGRQWSFVGGFL
jgi:hypothetical protein